MDKKILLLYSLTSATGNSQGLLNRLTETIQREFGTTLTTYATRSHEEVKEMTSSFLSKTPSLILVGGGGGTLRAVVESVAAIPPNEREHVHIAPLRMGSGNVLAKQLGIPADPIEALGRILKNEMAQQSVLVSVMRFEVGNKEGEPTTRFGVTLGGFGQLGRIPSDLARFHTQWPRIHKRLGMLLGVEKLTNMEYGIDLWVRFVWPFQKIEQVSLCWGNQAKTFPLLMGALLNFPIPKLPLPMPYSIHEPKLILHALPLPSRWVLPFLFLYPKPFLKKGISIEVSYGEEVVIQALHSDPIPFFIDEDPLVFYKILKIGVLGTLSFVPGY